jgi:uncharacterized protein YndB with AHSA1/START domain
MTGLDGQGQLTGPREVRFSRLLPGPIERVWAYITEPDLRATWLAGGPMEPRVGGRVELAFRHADLSPVREEPPERFRDMHEKGHAQICEVLAYDPPRLLKMTWGSAGDAPSEVTFELAPEGDEVRLVLTHRKLADRGEMVNVSSGWHTHLAILEDNLAGRTPAPFWSSWAAKAEAYEALLAKDI